MGISHLRREGVFKARTSGAVRDLSGPSKAPPWDVEGGCLLTLGVVDEVERGSVALHPSS